MAFKDRFKRMTRKSDSSAASDSTTTSDTSASLNKSPTNSSNSNSNNNSHNRSKGLPWRRRHAGSTATKSTASNDSASKNSSAANLASSAKKEEMRRYAAMFSSYTIQFGATNRPRSIASISPCTSPRASLDIEATE